MTRKKALWNRMVIVGLLSASVLLYSFSAVLAAPPHPPPKPPPPGGRPPGPPPAIGPPAPWRAVPPPGRVWFHFQGTWLAVPPPPGAGPYLWNGRVWVIDPTPPPRGAKWVPGHSSPRGWIAGHWARYPAPRPSTLGPGTLEPEGPVDAWLLEINLFIILMAS